MLIPWEGPAIFNVGTIIIIMSTNTTKKPPVTLQNSLILNAVSWPSLRAKGMSDVMHLSYNIV